MTTYPPSTIATPSDILATGAAVFGVTVAELASRDRGRPLVYYRQATMAAVRQLSDASYPAIGRLFGDRDHTTVMHQIVRARAGMVAAVVSAVQGAADDVSEVTLLRAEVAELREELRVATLAPFTSVSPGQLRLVVGG